MTEEKKPTYQNLRPDEFAKTRPAGPVVKSPVIVVKFKEGGAKAVISKSKFDKEKHEAIHGKEAVEFKKYGRKKPQEEKTEKPEAGKPGRKKQG
jgi:hypothetical protein